MIPQALFLGGGCGRKIDNGLLLRGSQYLTFTPAATAAGNVWTMVCGYHQAVATDTYLLSAGPDSSNYEMVRLELNGADPKLQYLLVVGGVVKCNVKASAKLRDSTGHSQLYASRNGATVTLGVNGMALASFDTNITAADNGQFGTATPHYIGRGSPLTTTCAQGVLSEFAFISGFTVPQSAIGALRSGVWTWSLFGGDYGANGGLLEFKTPAQLGKDTRPLGAGQVANHWTLNGVLSTDQSADTPSNVFATINPLDSVYSGQAPTGGNLRYQWVSPNQHPVYATMPVRTGKWYWEFKPIAGSLSCVSGVYPVSNGLNRKGDYVQYAAGGNAVCYRSGNGQKWVNGVGSAYGATYAINDVIGVALDLDSVPQTVTFFKNGVSQGAISLPISGQIWAPVFGPGGEYFTMDVQFGQTAFAHTPPAGFKPLCTANMAPSTPITSGSFVGNTSTDGQCIFCDGTPDTVTINGNAVTWGTHAIKLANGFKIISASSSYNASGTNTWVATFGPLFVTSDCRIPNPAQIN